ncbi:MAG: hypothetical protein JSS49_10230 [Planctomycetes bacterium]|nr:hypothetical protein [Planctomycetota bacterium]
MVKISGKALGRKKPLFADWSFPLPPDWSDGGGITLRMLIERIVRQQVAAFQQRQVDATVLRALTSRQIESAAETGRITMGESEVGQQPVDVEAAIGNAILAFEDGIYLVVVDDIEQKELDREIHLTADSRVTFLRLTLLAGG